MKILFGLVAFLVLIPIGCAEKQDPGGGGDDDGAAEFDGGVFYGDQIKPILDGNCISCHSSTQSGAQRNGATIGVDFNTYAAAKASGAEGNTRVQAGTMPPASQLSSSEKATMQQWVDDGFPE